MPPPDSASHQIDDTDGARSIEAVVVAIIPEFHQVKVRDGEGRLYALTRKTTGFAIESLREGQAVRCVVTDKPARVLKLDALR